MNLHQFKFVQEAARRNLNLTETAKALFTSQPGISKAILELEEELGVDIFIRHGKRLKRMTEPGQQVLKSIEVILREVRNLKQIGEEFSKQDAGRLSIAATHTQARYILPEPVSQLRKRFPKVTVSLHQGTPEEVARMLMDDTADIGLATESLAEHEELVTLPLYEWQHVVVMGADHPLATVDQLTLEQLAAEPLITYQPAFTGRRRIDQAFAQRRLSPLVVLEAIDSDVIKTYVRTGMGIGIVAEMAVQGDNSPGGGLIWKPAAHLFGHNTSRVAFRRGAYLRSYVLGFAELLSGRLSRTLIERAMQGHGDDFQL